MSRDPQDLVVGDDGLARCGWCASAEDYRAYHDGEWGRPVTDERPLFERICLEGFQSGLAWITILRRREGFRRAFADFDVDAVAAFGATDVERLLADTAIIRHRGKIEAAIANAWVVVSLRTSGRSLADLLWSFAPPGPHPAPTERAAVPATTPQSTALAADLRGRGMRFVGPTTAYALMQAVGMVNDHLAGCWVRDEVEKQRSAVLLRLP